MLKKLFLGLLIALMSTYAIQNPTSINSINRKNARNENNITYNSFIGDLNIRDFTQSEHKQYFYKIDVIFSHDNYLYSNFADSINDFDFDFSNNDNSNENTYFLTLYIASYKYQNDYFVGTYGYYNTIGYNEIENTFYISNATPTTYYQNEQITEYEQDILSFYLQYNNCYVVIENVIENDFNFDYSDFMQYVINDNRKAITPLFINSSSYSTIINNIQNSAFSNGKQNGYDLGYQEGLLDNATAFNEGYELGIGDNIIPKNIIGWFRIVARGVQSVLDIEILPYMKVGYIISIPIMFGLILFIIRLVRGD